MASRILVVGSGGREHALALRLLASESVSDVVVVPGNAGTSRSPIPGKSLGNVAGDPFDVALALRPELVVVGPEAPLCDGLVDRLAKEGIAAFGPTRAGARLEGSKAFMKDFVRRHGLLTARHETLRDPSDVERVIRSFERPPVVKADGLCAGKGVVVADTHAEAVEAAMTMLSGASFGDAGRTVVVEERIAGREASMHAITDGERLLILPSAQDHKRIGDGDQGPNTGGMGTYAPAPLVTDELAARVRRDIFEPTVRGMAAEGAPYRGVLFAGLMITESGEPYLLEFNVRFGDPETEVLMNVVDGDFGEALAGAARGRLDEAALTPSGRSALCVVMASRDYPSVPRIGDTIHGLDEAAKLQDVAVYHAGTKQDGDRVITAGGRVLGVTGFGATLRAASERAYRAVDCIRFDGAQFRRDIGASAVR